MATSPAFTDTVRDKKLPDLLMDADLVRDLTAHPAWKIVAAAVDAHRERLLVQLMSPGAKPDAVDRLRGEILGLQSMRDAADSIVQLAVDREREAKRAVMAQEPQHV